MSTALERMGADLNNDLWTAMVLAKKPELIKKVHINYLKAGADCGITCSYQATIPGLMKHGFTETEAEELIRLSVQLFLEAREEWWNEEGERSGRPYPLCLASVGPFGAYLADGSEYRGNYDVSADELYDFHFRRMQLLHEAGADMLLIETQPSMDEVLIEAEIAEKLGADYWISFSCRDRLHINDGKLLRSCAEILSEGHPRLRMLGINCTDPAFVESLIKELKASTELPVAVYPNSGLIYNPETKSWSAPVNNPDFGTYALNYMKAGAKAVGGCCTTTEEHIQKVVSAKKRYISMGMPKLINGRL